MKRIDKTNVSILQRANALASISIFLAVCFMSIPPSLLAANRTWMGTTSVNWNTAANWNAAAVPSGVDVSIFDANGGSTHPCKIDAAPPSFANVTMTNNFQSNFDFNGQTITLASPGANISFDLGGAGSFNNLTGAGISITLAAARGFIPSATSKPLPNISFNSTNTVVRALTVTTNALRCSTLTIGQYGAFATGAFPDTISGFAIGAAGTTSPALTLTANGGLVFTGSVLDLSGLLTVTVGGTNFIKFIGSNAQTFTPKSGMGAVAIEHSGAATLQMSTNAYTATSFLQNNGAFNFGGVNFSTTGAAGNFIIANGNSSSLVAGCLDGRTLTVTGNAYFQGTSGNEINLNASASVFTLAVTGDLVACNASIAKNTTTGSQGYAFYSIDNGNNSTWNFTHGRLWTGGGTTTNFTEAANWSGGIAPTSADTILFSGLYPSKNCALDADKSVMAVIFKAGYISNFNFNGHKLTVTDDANFSTGGTITAGGGTLEFVNSTPRNLTPKSGQVLPDLKLSGTDVITVNGAGLRATNLIFNNANASLTTGAYPDTVNNISGTGNTVTFTNNGGLVCLGTPVDLSGITTLSVGGTGAFIKFSSGSTQTFTPKAGQAHPLIQQIGANGTTVQNAIVCGAVTVTSGTLTLGGTMTASGTLTIGATGILNLGNNLTHSILSITAGAAGGQITFNNSTLQITGTAAALTNTTCNAGTGTLEFTNTANATLTPKSGSVMPDIKLSGTNRVTVNGAGFRCAQLICNNTSGTFYTGAYSDTITNLNTDVGLATFNFSGANANLCILGNADFSNVGISINTAASDSIKFISGSTQAFVPRLNATFPTVYHPGAGTLSVQTNNLICNGFYQNNGSLNLNGNDLNIVANYSLTISNNTARNDFIGSHITVASGTGNATFSGVDATHRLKLIGSDDWWIDVPATQSLTATNVDLAHSIAVTAGGLAISSGDSLNNDNWGFLGGKIWGLDGATPGNWNDPANWVGNVVPTGADTVMFYNGHTAPCQLNGDTAAKYLVFCSGASAFNFNGYSLTIKGACADFRNSSAITPGTGSKLQFTGSDTKKIWVKTGQKFPDIFQKGMGTTTISGASGALVKFGNLTIDSGAIDLGTGLLDTVGTLSGNGGSIYFNTASLFVTGNADFRNIVVFQGNGASLYFLGTGAQTFYPRAGATFPAIFQGGASIAGTTTISTNSFISAGVLTIRNGTLNLGSNLTHSVASIASAAPNTGAIDFGTSSSLQVNGNAAFSTIAVSPGTGSALVFSGAVVLTPHTTLDTLPDIIQNGAGGTTTVTTNNLAANSLTLINGTFSLGTGRTSIFLGNISGSGSINFNTGTLTVFGTSVDFSSLTTITPGTGTLEFAATSGAQTFAPQTGTTHPSIAHTGAGTLRLSGNDLITNGFSQTAGILDLAGSRNISTVNNGSFIISNGLNNSLAGLINRRITVNGYATLSGTDGSNLLNLDAPACTLDVTGALTAVYATVQNNKAVNSQGTGINCTDNGSNFHWNFGNKIWSSSGDNNWTTGGNWLPSGVPGPGDIVLFTNASSANCNLTQNVTVKSIIFMPSYSAVFNFATYTLSDSGVADLRATGLMTSNNGTLEFIGSGTQSFIPQPNQTFASVIQNGPGTTVQYSNNSYIASFVVSQGTFNLGSNLTDSVSTVSGAGNLNFNTSTLKIGGGTANFGSFTFITPGTGLLMFTGAGSQALSSNTGLTFPGITIWGASTQVVTFNSNITCVGNLAMQTGTVFMGSGLTHSLANITDATAATSKDTINFGTSNTITITGALGSGSTNFNQQGGIATIPGTGTWLKFTYQNGNYTYINNNAANNWSPNIEIAIGPTYTFTNTNQRLRAQDIKVTSGTFVTAGGTANSLIDTIGSLIGNGGGLNLTAGSNFSVSGPVINLDGFSTITSNFPDTLKFVGAAGTQVLTPKLNDTLAGTFLLQTGTGMLQLAGNPLIAGSLKQTNGVFNLNSQNISIVNGGSFTIINGNSGSITGLDNQTISVDGGVSLTGTTGSYLNLNPASTWTIAANGSLNAQYADIGNSIASVSNGFAINSTPHPGNINWTFFGSANIWQSAGAGSWSNAANWSKGVLPVPTDTVIFQGGSYNGDCNLDILDTVAAVIFAGTYTGKYSFTGETLSVTGYADFRLGTGGNIITGTGALQFIGDGNQSLIPRATDTLPYIIQNSSAGTGITTVFYNPLIASGIALIKGQFNLGANLAHLIGTVASDAAGYGGLNFGSSTMQVYDSPIDFSNLGTLTTGTGKLTFASKFAQAFLPDVRAQHPDITVNSTNTVTITGYNLSAKSLTMTAGTINLGGSLTNQFTSINAGTNGTINFTNSTMQVSGNANMSLLTVIPGTGKLEFTNTTATTFTPKANQTYPKILQSGIGTTTVGTSSITAADTLFVTGGVFNLGAGFTHTFKAIVGSGASTLNFNTSTLRTSAPTVDLSGFNLITPASGILAFTGTSGVQTFIPQPSDTMPAISHTGADTLRLSTYDLAANAFSQSDGALDFNGRNITTVSNGNFILTDGTSSSFINQGGQRVTVSGYMSVAGQSGNLLDMNPSSYWSLAVNGLLTADFATVAKCSSLVSLGIGTANCIDNGNNYNWTFSATREWSGGGTTNNWSEAANWVGNTTPGANEIAQFSARSIKNCILDIFDTVSGVIVASGYVGIFNFGSETLSVKGNVNFSNAGTVIGGTGALQFIGDTIQTFIPKAGATFPTIIQNGNGGTTISNTSLWAGPLIINKGTFNLGLGFTHSVSKVKGSGSGALNFNTSTLQASGDSVNLNSIGSIIPGTGTLTFTGATTPQLFIPKLVTTHPNITQNGAAGTTVCNYPVTAGNLAISSGTFHLGTNLTHSFVNVSSAAAGAIDFGSSNLQVSGSSVDFSALQTVTKGTGSLAFSGTSAQNFIPKSSAAARFPKIIQSGASQTTVITNNLSSDSIIVNAGIFNLGTGLTDTVGGVRGTGGLIFGSTRLYTAADSINFNTLSALTAGTGTMVFTGAGTQIFVPKTAAIHPSISHTGPGTLKLSGIDTLIANSLGNSAGIFNFNNGHLRTLGDFTITGGNASTLSGLDNRTIIVGGNASLAGTFSQYLALNPTGNWTIAVTGALTATYATLKNSIASLATGTAINCTNSGGNSNWTFINMKIWNGSADNNWSNASNWNEGIAPLSTDSVLFNATSVQCNLPSSQTIKAITFTPGYTGTFNFAGYTLTLTSAGDFRSNGALVAPRVTMDGATAQTFIPKSGTSFTKIIQNAIGYTTTIATNNLTADTLNIIAGTVNLGSGKTHTITTVLGAGTLDFGSSTLQTAAADFNLNTLAGVTAGTGTLKFTKSTGTAQVFTPKNGATHPAISHTGTDTLRFSSNDVSAASFSQNAGVLDFNGRNLSCGTFTISNGTAATMAGLGGRTISVTGDATLSGQSGNLLNLNPAVAWTVSTASGSINANYATIDNSTASASGSAFHSVDAGGGSRNHGWTFPTAKTWIGSVSDANWNTITNWSDNAVPISTDSVIFMSSGFNCNLNTSPSVKYLVFLSSYTGTFDFKTNSITISNNADFRSSGAITAGTGTIILNGTSTQILTPKASTTLPAISHTGNATLQLAVNDLTCNSFSQTTGYLDLNGKNITTVNNGNFTIANGTSTSFANLGDRTITVSGNATFNGQSGSHLDLNPSSSWTISATKNLTADYADIKNSNAASAPGIPTGNCVDQTPGSCTNWYFQENYAGWSHSRQIPINTTAGSGGSNVSTNLLNYPLLIRLRAGNFDFDSAQSGGADIRFASASGNALFYEVGRWVNGWGTADSADIWVRVDTIYGNNSTQTITMYWGKSSATSRSNGASVFIVDKGSAGVWHLSATLQDATANNNDATNYSTSDIVGLSGRARYFDGNSTTYLRTGSSGLGITSKLTLSSWIKLTDGSKNSYMRIISKKNSWNSNYGYDLYIEPYNKTIHMLAAGTTPATSTIGTAFGTGWHYVCATVNGTAATIYWDGASVSGSTTVGALQTDATVLSVGRQTVDATDPFYGTIDEPTVSDSVRSANWIKMNYETQKENATCINWQYPFVSGIGDTTLISARQAGPDSTLVFYELEDPDNTTNTISAEYRINAGAWGAMTNTSGDIGATIDATHPQTKRTILWRSKTQLGAGIDTLYNVRVIATDGTYKDTTASPLFRIDTKPPTGLGSFTSSEVTGSTITLTWTAASDRVFQEYTIWYGTTQSDVQNRTGTAAKWDKTKDAALAAAATTSTIITGLTPGGNYFWKIWAADSGGNEATVADVNIPTPQMVSTQWSRTFVGPVTGGAVQENSIYVGTSGSENTLFSINLGDGTTRWSYVTSAYGACNMPTYIYSVKAGGKYRVTASAGYYVICRQDEGNSSSEIFTPVNLGAAAGNPYANPDDSTFTVVYGNNVVRKKITNGTTLSGWPVALSNASRLADPVVFNDEAFVATTDGVVIKYYMDGTPGPQVNVGAAVNLPLLIDDSTLFVSPNNDTLYAFRMATMAQKWKIKVGGTNSGPAFSLSYGKGSPSRIIYAAASKKVQRITDNGGTASIDWTYDAADTVASGPIIFNGTVYFGRNGNRYYAITDNGTSASLVNKWPFTGSSGNANVGPWIDVTNNRAIFGSTGGKLDAFTLP